MTNFQKLSPEDKKCVEEFVRAQWEVTVSIDPGSYVSQNARADPVGWKERLCEVIAANPAHVQQIVQRMRRGFTLVELSIVLVVIGLIAGGVLVGRSLVVAAGVRATITQIDKFNQAANTFFGKYGYLPGDIPAVPAARFGFIARNPGLLGTGDGNGVIEGNYEERTGANDCGLYQVPGETTVFWVDLGMAGLIEESFTTASNLTYPSIAVTPSSSPGLNNYLPKAKLGDNNYVFVWSGGTGTSCQGVSYNSVDYGNGMNYFGVASVSAIGDGGAGAGKLYSGAGLTVNAAYAIDQKIDDGFPQSGNVTAIYIKDIAYWAGTTTAGSPFTTATPEVATSCFDNGGNGGTAQRYSVGAATGNGANVNCALSFKIQAGD